jgi:outer membrane receptor protein involved in Fe transport
MWPTAKAAQVTLVIIVSLLFCTYQAAGQSRQAAEVRGTVIDRTGAVVPGVTVTLTNVLMGTRQQVTTDASGLYDAPWVRTGEYTISFEKRGFTRFTRTGIVLQLETVTIDATLEVGSATEVVTVTANAALIQTETPEASFTLTAKAVIETPNVGRSWDNLLALVPGVNGAGGQQATGQAAGVNGMGGNQYAWQIDGGNSMFPTSQNADLLIPPLDAIDEVKLTTSNFGAEYGGGLAVFNVSTKSGTNQWHGTLFEYVQNDFLDARNYFNTPATGPKAPLRWNEFGGTVGGPIRRNKLFFFFSYQRNPTKSYVPGFALVPTDVMRNISGNGYDFSGLNPIFDPATTQCSGGSCTRQQFPGNVIPANRVDPVGLAILQSFPRPNRTPDANGNNYYYSSGLFNNKTQSINGKVDYDLSSNNRLSASMMHVTYKQLNDYTPFCAIDCDYWNALEYQGQLTDVWTFRPRVVGEFRLAVNHVYGNVVVPTLGQGFPAKLGLKNPGSDIFPSITVSGTIGDSLGSGGVPQAIDAETAIVPAATLTWVRGKHILKFGGEFDRWQSNGGWPLANEGNFNFNGQFTADPSPAATSAGEGFADLLLGLPNQWSVAWAPETGGRSWSGQSFVQDEYKIRKNLTLTAGVRWVAQSGWTEVENRVSNFDPKLVNPATNTLGAIRWGGAVQNTIWDFFAPRVGFAWSPGSHWSVRGGYGLYNMTWGAYAFGGNMGTGWGASGALLSPDLVTPIFTLSQGPPPPTYLTNATRTPDALNGTGVAYYPAHTPMPYSQQYRFAIQHEFRGGVVAEAAYVANRGLHLPFSRDMNQVPAALLGSGRQPYPQYTSINAFLDRDYSRYNALQTTLQKNFANGLLFSANYTWSHALDTMTINAWQGLAAVWQNANDLRAEYGNSSADMRHTFSGNVVYELPFGRGKRFMNRGGLLNGVFGGWEISSLFQVHSGIPFTPVMADNSLEGALGSGTWRPNRIGNGKLSNPSNAEWFDTSAFVPPAPNTFGNSRQNILFGPSWKDVDFKLAKDFKITEKVGLNFSAESFDAFNIPNFGQPDPAVGSPTVGQITSANTSRKMQLGAKVHF